MKDKNFETMIEGNFLIIKVDISNNFGRSKTGKSRIIATGWQDIISFNNEKIKIDLNLSKLASSEEKSKLSIITGGDI